MSTGVASPHLPGQPLAQDPRPRTRSRRRLAAVTATLVVGFIILLDQVVGALLIPPDRNAFRTINPAYHHGFLPMTSGTTRWGGRDYPFATNSLGMRDAAPRRVAPQPSGRRIVFLGDSFVEGMGVTWQESFVGIVADRLAPAGVEVLNAGAVSYSPRLYELRLADLLQREGLRMDELYVFIDISDILDELFYEGFRPHPAVGWRDAAYRIDRFLMRRSFLWWRIRTPAAARSRDPVQEAATAFWVDSIAPKELITADFGRGRALWTVDREVFDRWGRKGMKLALGNMVQLANLCRASGVRLAIAVYPWPDQILRRDLESLQVVFWRNFAATYHAEFINLFPLFINERPAQEVIDSCFIAGDSHWSAAGHRLVADALLERIRDGSGDAAAPRPRAEGR